MESISISLSSRDFNVLQKIKDPEWNPSMTVTVDDRLPKDSHVPDPAVYDRITQRERDIIRALQQLEMRVAGPASAIPMTPEMLDEYRRRVSDFADLIHEYPNYASARNNRAQGFRRLYGNGLFLSGVHSPVALLSDADIDSKEEAGRKAQNAHVVLSDLDEAIRLLTPKAFDASISPQAGKTLSSAHTQRAAIYHTISKSFDARDMTCLAGRRESSWSKLDFEEAASGDFALGGRYGNEIAKGLAVSTNPTAKLCGEMVATAMRKEYGPGYGGE
ncbi:hypothetical protein GGR52DRAFT_567645 [Hypoxylon sp. FL1284]|nr:hypothetical protein GGR52DRAFT_567645 [Hypoxylon sp. FL1284]